MSRIVIQLKDLVLKNQIKCINVYHLFVTIHMHSKLCHTLVPSSYLSITPSLPCPAKALHSLMHQVWVLQTFPTIPGVEFRQQFIGAITISLTTLYEVSRHRSEICYTHLDTETQAGSHGTKWII